MNLLYIILSQTYYGIKLYLSEFDDGSDWTLSKCLTHANHTVSYYLR